MDRTEKCEKKFGKLFGGKPTVSEGSDPEFMRILQRFIFGEVSYTGSLDDRMRELITVTVLTVYRRHSRRNTGNGVQVRAFYRLSENS